MLNRGAASAVPAGAISEALQLHTWTLTIGLAQARKAFGAGCRPVLPSVQAHYTNRSSYLPPGTLQAMAYE